MTEKLQSHTNMLITAVLLILKDLKLLNDKFKMHTRWFQIMGIAKRGGHCFKNYLLKFEKVEYQFFTHRSSVGWFVSLCYQQKCRNYSSALLPWWTGHYAPFLNKLAHNMQTRPRSLDSIFAFLHDVSAYITSWLCTFLISKFSHDELVVFGSIFHIQPWWIFSSNDRMIATTLERIALHSGVLSVAG